MINPNFTSGDVEFHEGREQVVSIHHTMYCYDEIHRYLSTSINTSISSINCSITSSYENILAFSFIMNSWLYIMPVCRWPFMVIISLKYLNGCCHPSTSIRLLPVQPNLQIIVTVLLPSCVRGYYQQWVNVEMTVSIMFACTCVRVYCAIAIFSWRQKNSRVCADTCCAG